MIAHREVDEVDEDQDEIRGSNYPPRWGMPVGTPFSEERLSWVREHVRRETKGQEVRKRITGMQARIELLRKRWAPGQEVR